MDERTRAVETVRQGDRRPPLVPSRAPGVCGVAGHHVVKAVRRSLRAACEPRRARWSACVHPRASPSTLVRGDITRQSADVIVNAANSSLLGGGGVDGAIHRRGGPEILAACRELRASRYGKGLRTGRAVATTAGALDAQRAVHTAGGWGR